MTGSATKQQSSIINMPFTQFEQNFQGKSPYIDMKASNSSQNQIQQLQSTQPYATVMTSSFQQMNKEMTHSHSSNHSNNSNSQSPISGLKQLDILLGQTQGSDNSNDEEYPLSDDEGIENIPFPRKQQQNAQQIMDKNIKPNTQVQQFVSSQNFYMNHSGQNQNPLMTSSGQMLHSRHNASQNLMTSSGQMFHGSIHNPTQNSQMTSSGQMIHGNVLIQPYLQNQNLNSSKSACILNQGQVLGMGQQSTNGVFLGQFQPTPNNILYQQMTNPYQIAGRQNQQASMYHPNLHLIQQSAQVPMQQFNDSTQLTQYGQLRPGFHSMSSQVPNTGKQYEEHMGTFNGSTYIKQGFLEDSKPSQVVYVNHLMNKDINVNHLYNVFSNFGDIVKIVMKRQKCTAFIEYTMQENATKAKEYMDKKIFFENEIRVFYSHFETLQKQEDKNQEQFIGSEQTNRFQKDSKMTLNPPSLVLHISSLKQEVCDHEKMHEIFRPFGKIEAIHIEKVPPRYMCHIKFSSLKESLMAVAYMHNKEIKGRKMLISFTRKKLDQSIKNLVTYSKNLQTPNSLS